VSARLALAVLGAINVDLVVAGAPLPRPGETVTGGTFARHDGGKGGNQATAAARALGAAGRVAMLGAVGDDDLGHAARGALETEGVDVAGVRTVPGVATGVALIAVDARGENQISVAPGANGTVSDPTAELARSRPALVLASAEVPIATLEAAAAWCRAHDVTFVLNPAPFAPELRGLLDRVTIVTPNEREVAALAGIDDPLMAALSLRADHPKLAILVTLGAEGAVVADESGEARLVTPDVDVVDTTGAGDCLNGVLAAGLLEGLAFREAARRAVDAASLSTTVHGAREGMPSRERLEGAGR
jgi:ribokinase